MRRDFPTAHAQNLSPLAQSAQRPVGFADIVGEGEARGHFGAREASNAGARKMGYAGKHAIPAGLAEWTGSSGGSGCPRTTSSDPDEPARAAQPRWARSTGQGSGFFISADGYAVTNNHVGRQGRDRRDHDRRRQDLQREGDRHRSAHRSRADQGRGPQRLPVVQFRRPARRASATGCWRSAIRSASAEP